MAWVEKIGPRSRRVRYPQEDRRFGSISGFDTRKAATNYANDLEADRRRGTWLDPAAGKTTVAEWSALWVETLDVETRTDENYRSRIRNYILPRWGSTALGAITALAVTLWNKQLPRRYAAFHRGRILTVFSMMLDDAVDERLIAFSPVRRRAKRGRRREQHLVPVEHVGRGTETAVIDFTGYPTNALCTAPTGEVVFGAGWDLAVISERVSNPEARWDELETRHHQSASEG